MTVDELVTEIMSVPNLQLHRFEVEQHVRNGRGHGHPDCCIKAFVVAYADPNFATPDEQAQRLMALARRRVCDECKTKMLEQAELPFIRKEAQIELVFSDVRKVLYALAAERRKNPPDMASYQARLGELKKAVDAFCEARNAGASDGGE